MKLEELLQKWEQGLPRVRSIAEQVDRTYPRPDPADEDLFGPYRRRRAALKQALSEVEMVLELPLFAEYPIGVESYTSEELLDYWRRAAEYVNVENPEVQAEVRSAMPLMRINAPAWYRNPEFVAWLRSEGVATWHVGRESPHGCSDAFFTFHDGEGGTDYPGDDDRPGIPKAIWEHLEFMVADEYGRGAEVLVWVSNLEQ